MAEPITFVIIGAGIAVAVTAIIAGFAIALAPKASSPSDKADFKTFLEEQSAQSSRRSSVAVHKNKDFAAYRHSHEEDRVKLL
jgi:hypothetical protein